MIGIEQIIGFALKNRSVLDQLGQALRSDLVVANPLYRQVAEFVDDFVLEYRELPKSGDYDLWISSLPERQQPGIREALGRLLRQDVEPFSPEHFGEMVIEELKRTAARTALSRLGAMEEVTPEAFQIMQERVEQVSTSSLTGLADLRDLEIWIDPPSPERQIPTGIPGLDHYIGGWGEELWIVFADSGIGKSMLLQNFGAAAARRGKRVLHISLELGIRPLIHRYYRQIAAAERSDFRARKDWVRDRLVQWFRFAKGEVLLLEFPAYGIDSAEIGRIIDRVQRTRGEIGVIILDYLDLLNLPPHLKSRGGYEDLGRLTHLIRSWCPAYSSPVLTASQAIRKPQHKGRLTTKDMGDSYGKVRGADGLLSLVQTPEEEETHQGRLGILKSRESGGRGREIPVYINRDLALISDLDHPSTIRLMERFGHLPEQQKKVQGRAKTKGEA